MGRDMKTNDERGNAVILGRAKGEGANRCYILSFWGRLGNGNYIKSGFRYKQAFS